MSMSIPTRQRFSIAGTVERRDVTHLSVAQMRRDMLHQMRMAGAAAGAGFEKLQLQNYIFGVLAG